MAEEQMVAEWPPTAPRAEQQNISKPAWESDVVVHQSPDRRSQGRTLIRSLRPLVLAWSATLTLWTVLLIQPVPIDGLLIDSASAGIVPWYRGLVSSIGILLWAVTVCGCAATAFVSFHGERHAATRAFRGAAIFFGFLLLDDLFLLHSSVLPNLVPVSKQAVLLFEALLGLLWLVPAWPEIRRTRWEILIMAALALGSSIGLDLIFDQGNLGTTGLVFEDGTKFLGGVALATWATVTAGDVIRSVVRN